jgi:nucleotide-binding universal stress UspA family protein
VATIAPQRGAVHPSVAYRRILVPVDAGSRAAVATACALAAGHGALVVALGVTEVPAALPLEAHMPEEETKEVLTVAEAIGDRYGVRVDRVTVHAREAAEAIVRAAEELDAELIVIRRGLDKTVRHVLQHAHCRVLYSRP